MSNLENFPPSPDITRVEGIRDPFAFQKFCIRIGAIPKNYTETLTVEEQILYFIDFLQNTVIPSININADTVNSLIDEFNNLYNYVHNYFNNLDVQEEVNNKLNQMAESGELTEIITQYIAQCVIVFNTVNDMKQAQNLIVNSKCRTLGFHEIGDYGNAYYIIKENLTANEKNIIALNNGLFAELIIEDNTICPQSLGAYGYLPNTQSSSTYNNTKQDSTEILQFTTEFAINNHIQNIDYKGLIYNCSGNNIIGLPIKEVNRNYQLNIDGKGATFYWDSTGAENFSFAFVGYLRGSIWKNINIRCLNNNYKGNIFTTHFDIDNQQHYFSENKFLNININSWWTNGSCNKIFDFTTDSVNAHDDLSIFERITAHYYNEFFYTNNNESVNNSFINCYTISYKENTVDFNIDCENWAGHLNINNHQFILQEANCTLIKTALSSSTLNLPINLNNCRLEARNSKFCFADLKGYNLYINELRPLAFPNIDTNNIYYKVGKYASLVMKNCINMPQFMQIETNDNESQAQILLDNCSFYNNNITTPMPIITFLNYTNYQALKKDGIKYFHKLIIKNGISSTKSNWFNDFLLAPYDYKLEKAFHQQNQETYRSMYIPDGNLVIETLKIHNSNATSCSITIADYDGQNIAFKQNINFENGIGDATSSQKCVLPQGKVKTLNVSLKDSSGNMSDNTCIIELEIRPIFYSDEFDITQNKWINK